MGAVTLVVFAVLLLVLWRNGTLKRLITPAEERRSDIANRGGSETVVDKVPALASMPTVGGPKPSAAAVSGSLYNGFSPTAPALAAVPVIVPTDPGPIRLAETLAQYRTLPTLGGSGPAESLSGPLLVP